jgi:hypothetical protein
MAAAQVVPVSEITVFDGSKRNDRQQAVDSVLGTMAAEGELPSSETIELMQKFVQGHVSMHELVETIFTNARK